MTSMSLHPHFLDENTAFQRAYDISEIIEFGVGYVMVDP